MNYSWMQLSNAFQKLVGVRNKMLDIITEVKMLLSLYENSAILRLLCLRKNDSPQISNITLLESCLYCPTRIENDVWRFNQNMVLYRKEEKFVIQ